MVHFVSLGFTKLLPRSQLSLANLGVLPFDNRKHGMYLWYFYNLGGGSDHEPAHGGFVGEAMLTATIYGHIEISNFNSPRKMKLTNKGLMDFLHAGLPATKLTDYSESALFSKIDEIIFSSEEHCRFAKVGNLVWLIVFLVWGLSKFDDTFGMVGLLLDPILLEIGFLDGIGNLISVFVGGNLSFSAATGSGMRRRFPIFSIGRLYCTGNAEAAPQLSIDLIKIMDQRLSAIENRNAHLERFLDQPELTPSEYSTANKELRKLRDSVHLISELRAKQQVTQPHLSK
uniref:DhaK domain-containing protein n=1 Tax=Solanum lycopersicum TaxID=4081 RepID=A0A3Q7FJG6_SOLLC